MRNAVFARLVRGTLATTLLLLANAARADVWDNGPDGPDDSPGTKNVLIPFAPPQLHDLASAGGVADVDWFRVGLELRRSYDVTIHNSNVDWLTGRTLELFEADGTTLYTPASPLDRGQRRPKIRWIHFGVAGTWFVKVAGLSSDTAAAVYEIALRETTLYCPRFNNAGSQASVLIVQRAASERAELCTSHAYFYDEAQTYLGYQSMLVGPDDVNVFSLPLVPGLGAQKGHAHIAHDCGVGGLKAKIVSLEPSTGFSFDTVCSPRDQ
jgi:hypothetical protein